MSCGSQSSLGIFEQAARAAAFLTGQWGGAVAVGISQNYLLTYLRIVLNFVMFFLFLIYVRSSVFKMLSFQSSI